MVFLLSSFLFFFFLSFLFGWLIAYPPHTFSFPILPYLSTPIMLLLGGSPGRQGLSEKKGIGVSVTFCKG